jgi:predicted nucleotidyltransferase
MDSEVRDLGAIAARLRGLLEPRPEILEVYIFGSRARGEGRSHSDLDVAVFIDETEVDGGGFGYHAALTTDLMAGVGSNDVDVVILNQAPPLLYHRVMRDGIRIFSRHPAATTTREAMALSRYFDFLPQLDKIDTLRRKASSLTASEP